METSTRLGATSTVQAGERDRCQESSVAAPGLVWQSRAAAVAGFLNGTASTAAP
jgi:hypothetical protein